MDPAARTRTLADLVAEVPCRAWVLDRLGLDFCCHGQRTLTDACADAGLDVDVVAGQLEDCAGPVEGVATDDDDAAAIVDDIVATHHRYLRDELPALEQLAEKVEGVHGERHPELAEVRTLVTAIRTDLEPHLDKEEMVLFPAIRRLVDGQRDFPFGPVASPIRVMRVEHDRAGELLAALRRASGGFTTPADGCASYQLLYARLAQLEADTHLHIHKENNVLFPRVMALEATPTRVNDHR
jgi:regulator of cell morphogenesis and NO signaling